MNGIVTSVRVLREVGNLLVDVNGQNSSQALKESGMQLNLLDRIAGTSTKASRFASKLTHMQSLEQKVCSKSIFCCSKLVFSLIP